MKTLLYNNKKVFFSFFILLASTVFLSFFILLYVLFQKVTYKTISSYSSEFLERIDTVSYSLLNNIKESAMQMFYTSSITNLRTKKNLTTSERITGLRDLGNLVGSSDILDSIMVYNGHENMIFSSNGTYPNTNSADFPDKEAVEILTNPNNYPYLTPIKRTVESSTDTYYSFLFYENQSSVHSSLLVNIKASWYESQLWGISRENDYIIIDSQGNIVISNHNTSSDHLDTYWQNISKESNGNKEEGFIIPSILSKQPGYLYHKMQISDWYYIKPIYLNDTVPGLVPIRNFLFISFTIISSFMLLFILYILIKVYFPFHYIRNLLISYSQSESNQGSNTSMEYLVKNLQETKSIQQITQLNSGVLPFGFSFPIFMIIVEHCHSQSIHTILKEHFNHIVISKDDKITRCAVHSCTKVQFESFLCSLDKHCRYKLYVSNLCFSPQDLVRSHEALIELRELSFLYPEIFLMSQALLAQCHSISGFKTKDVSSLTSALKAGQFEDAWNYWNTILSSISRDHYSDFLFAIHYLNKQLATLEAELGLKKPLEIDSLLENITDILYLNQYMKERLLLIANASASKKKEHLDNFSAEINQYIGTQYKKDNFTAQQVAEAFQMNLAYLNRQYRKSLGISISDAIHRIRIEQACTLLCNTDYPIETVAHHVGYVNTKYFFVIFKKWTNLTPNQYRTSKDPNKGINTVSPLR